MRARHWLLLLPAAMVAALLLVACGGDDDSLSWDARSVAEAAEGVPVQPVVLNSTLGPGQNRVMVALFRDGVTVGDASVSAQLYRLAEDTEADPTTAEPAGALDLVPRTITPSTDHIHQDGSVHRHQSEPITVFVGYHEFDPGRWGVAFDIDFEGERYGPRVVLFVQEETSEPAIGDPAPQTVQRTTRDAPIEQLDSANPPNPELHDTTIAEAVTSGRPSVIAFVTPAFCQTQLCGPVLEEVVLPAYEQYGDRVEFVHVEPWDLERARQGQLVAVDAVREWGLVTEPFVFVVDAEGRVAAKFEGIMEVEELTSALDRVLEGEPAAAAD